MNKINKYIAGMGVAVMSLATFNSCIEEVEPQSSTVIESQVNQSSSAVKALVWGLPYYFNACARDYHFEFGYGAMLHMRDVMTGDLPVNPSPSGYDWFAEYEQTTLLNQDAPTIWYVWAYYNKFIQNTNVALSAIANANKTGMEDKYAGYEAVAKAFRAIAYLEMAQMYEFKTNDKFTTGVNADGNNVEGLTVPIVTEKTTLEEARNNPRATKEVMQQFILDDLTYALENIDKFDDSDKVFPHKAEVYGLMARFYMWKEDYPKAQEAARNAINNYSGSPMSQNEALSKTSGFNDLSKFMWGAKQTDANESVKTGIINWTSWMSNETSFGYASAEPFVMIDANMYDRIGNSDWRKLMWKAPEGSPLEGKTEWIDAKTAESYPDYASAKFRPVNGDGDNYTVGAASAYPVMRVEEMYFIEAEAAAHQNAEKGKELLEKFMKTYRNKTYSCSKTDQDDVIEEIVFQKRVELWGEGLTFFDIKRLNYSVERGYLGTNFGAGTRFNTQGRPAWMNFTIYRTEAEDNPALEGWNNPNPTSAYSEWTGK